MAYSSGTYGKKVAKSPKKGKNKKRKQAMSGKRLDLFGHDKKSRSKSAYHI